jgi:hypothetical protein
LSGVLSSLLSGPLLVVDPKDLRTVSAARAPARLQGPQGQHGTFDFVGQPVAGEVKSGTALRLIREWAAANRSQLETNWANMEAGRALERIEPLE